MNEILKINNLQKYYGNKKNIVKAINGISFMVKKNEFVGVMGASGCGKTTLLNVISTIDRATNGEIYINDEEITKINPKDLARFRRENLGFVFQDFKLLDTLTAEENIALALTIKGTDPLKIKKKVKDISEYLNIESILDKYPFQISGGQKQRVACARAMVANPSLILADEPTGALDSEAAIILLKAFEKMKIYATILMVTHDPIAASYCDRIIFMKDGKIYEQISKEGENNREDFLKQILKIMAHIGEGDKSVL